MLKVKVVDLRFSILRTTVSETGAACEQLVENKELLPLLQRVTKYRGPFMKN